MKLVRLSFRLGCLVCILGPILALVLYPRAKWLFALVFIGPAVLWLDRRMAKDPTPQALADQIERLLVGNFAGWDVDDFEMQSIRNPHLQELHRRTLTVGGLPEEWVKLSEDRKNQLRKIIEELRAII
jgi:hypothetical protein